MRFSSIVVATTAICFATITSTSVVHAVPIPAEDSPAPPRFFVNGVPSPDIAAVIPGNQQYAADATSQAPPVIGGSKIILRRKKRAAPAPAGPGGTTIGMATPVLNSVTSPVTGATAGSTTGLGTALTGAQSIPPPVGAKDLDVGTKVTEVQGNVQGIAASVDGVFGAGAPPKQP